MYLRPDPPTFAAVPWRAPPSASDTPGVAPSVGRLICDVLMPTGERFEGDPRAVLRAALEAGRRGWATATSVAPELEFFLLREDVDENAMREPLPHDRGGYFDLSTDLAADVRREIVAELANMGMRIESSHHEVAAGQHEIDFVPADALADRRRCRHRALRHQGHCAASRPLATFLPKPFFGVNGSGMHTHQQLVRTERRLERLRRSPPTPATASPDWGATSSRGSSLTRRGCAPSSRRWSTRTSGWCRASRRR